jgi:hypothetical protein
MSLPDRFILASTLALVWALWVVPFASEQIKNQQMERSGSFHEETSGQDDNDIDKKMEQLMAMRSELLTAEEERTVALWGVLSEADQKDALLRIHAVQNLHYEGDPRFVEKETPSLVKATIQNYGFQHTELPATLVTRDALSVERESQLKALIAWVQQKKASPSEAEQLLGGSLDLLKLQQQRMETELNIEAHREQDGTE